MKARARKLALLLSVTMVLGSIDTGMIVMAEDGAEVIVEEAEVPEEEETVEEEELEVEENTVEGEEILAGEENAISAEDETEQEIVENEQVLSADAAGEAPIAVQNVDAENQVATYADDEEVGFTVMDDGLEEYTVPIGETFTLKVVVYSGDPEKLQYQWAYYNGLYDDGPYDIPGANEQQYVVKPADTKGRTYFCTVTDGKTTVTTSYRYIDGTYDYGTMDWDLVGTYDCDKGYWSYYVKAKLGQNLEFGVKNVTTTLNHKITYQWYKSTGEDAWAAIDGATAQTYKMKMGCTDPTTYRLSMTDGKTIIDKNYYIQIDGKTGNTHTYPDKWTVRTAATYTKEGVAYRTCSKCGAEETKVLEKLKNPVKLTSSKATLKEKKTLQLTSLLKGIPKGEKISSAKSSNTKVATVTANGKVTAKKAGSATITFTTCGTSYQVKVTVQKSTVATTKISKVPANVKLTVGGKKTLFPVITPKNATDKVTYSSSNTKIATVSGKGVITAKKAGTATITVKSGKKSVKTKVTVTQKSATGITGVPGSKTLKKGKSFTIKAKVTPSGAYGKLTYKTSDKKVVTVDAKGKVTAKKKGTATITVTVGKIKKTCKVTVK